MAGAVHGTARTHAYQSADGPVRTGAQDWHGLSALVCRAHVHDRACSHVCRAVAAEFPGIPTPSEAGHLQPRSRDGSGDEGARFLTIVMPKTNAKPTLRRRAVHEFKELVIISLYLYVTLGAVILLKTAVLHSDGIEFSPWGVAIVKAVVLAKFMLLGEAIKIGGRTTTGPLVWPTLQKAFVLLVVLIALTVIEEAVVGLFHHRSIAASLGELFGSRLEETLAGYLIMLLVLIPYCAFRVLGEDRLTQMFFVE